MPAPKLGAEIKRKAKWFVDKGEPQHVANAAWAFATLGYDAPNLFLEIDRQSKWLVEEGTTQAVANVALAFATLGIDAPSFFAELDRNKEILLKDENPQAIANACFAVSVLGRSKSSEALLLHLWDRAAQLFDAGAVFTDEGMLQLAQAQACARAEGVELPEVPMTMSRKMKSAMAQYTPEDNKVSRSVEQVSKALKEIGFDHELEVSPGSTISGGMLAIDLACKERMIAIEFDGPSHYLKALGTGMLTTKENGGTKAKRRFLKQLGWTVINLDFRDYMEADRKSNLKQWLGEKLKAAGVNLLQ